MFEKDKSYHITVKEKFAWIDEISTAFVTKPRYKSGSLVEPGKHEFKVVEFNFPLIRGVFITENGEEEKIFTCSLKKQAAHGF